MFNEYKGMNDSMIVARCVVDPFVLQEAGIVKELYHPQDYASNAVVLCLCLIDTSEKLIKSDFLDKCNIAVTMVSLLIVRMWLFVVNSKSVSCRVFAEITYMSTVWITSFQSFGH